MIGFTGTRRGMTAAQLDAVRAVLGGVARSVGATAVLHGDCLGADAQFDGIAAELELARYTLPCNLDRWRAHCELRGAIQLAAPAMPLVRNGWIVERCAALIGAPREMREQPRSGTWCTIRRARNTRRPHVIVEPDGEVRWFT